MRIIAVTVALITCLSWSSETQTPETANAIIERVDRIMRGNSSRGVARMEVITEHWERQLTMELWSLGTDYSLVRVRAPTKEAGLATLMVADNIWNYFPKIDRAIKVPVSMMSGSWMGSHWNNDDLVKESQLVEDYDIEMTFDGKRETVSVWEFTLTPKPDAAVIWGRVDYQVRQNDYMPLWAKFFDEDGSVSRTMLFSAFKNLGGRVVPSVIHMQPENKPDERTTVYYDELEFDFEIHPSFFSLQNLKQQR